MKNILIFGASGAIGREIAEKFASKNANVALCYNTSFENAQNAILNIREKYNVKAVAIKCDVKSSSEVKKAVEKARLQLGFIDTLVTCQGISSTKLITQLTDEEIDNQIQVNLRGVIYCIRESLPYMIEHQRGCIINISSMWGETGASCETVYSATKAGIIGLTKGVAKEVAPSNIRVNCVSPGVIKSPMLDCYSENDLKSLAEETPLSRLGEAKDVANAVVFLASDEASFITGQTLSVNGGFVI